MRVADDAILVYDKRRPFGVALRTKHAILLRYVAVRPEIAQQKNPLDAQ
jgi:hypothetical protein